MPVTNNHRSYNTMAMKWKRCRDAYGGTDTIQAAGEAYLPKLSEQLDAEYKAYQKRAVWYGATRRTVQGLSGAVMRKEPALTLASEDLKAHIENVTLTGVSLAGFAKMVIEEVLQVGRGGVLCDMSDDTNSDPVNRRPYWCFYAAEAIKNWRTEIRDGVPVLVQVVLLEQADKQKNDDEFAYESVPKYRVLRLNQEGKYEVQVYEKVAGHKDEFVPGDVTVPQRLGQPLNYIPFVFVNPTSITPDTEDPPLIDLVDVNLAHYRNSADFEHGLHYCGLPTPWASGFPATAQLKIGSSVAWVTDQIQARVGMLEFTGQGLGALEKALAQREKQMAVLGARLLEQQQPAVESNDTIVTRTAGERSILQSMCQTVSQALTQVLHWHAAWMKISEADMRIALNQDFVNANMPTDLLLALIQARQSGEISRETFYHNLEKGELTRPGVDFKAEQAEIQKDSDSAATGLNPEIEAMVNMAIRQKQQTNQPQNQPKEAPEDEAA